MGDTLTGAFAIVMIDLNDFKQINVTNKLDALLQMAGQRMYKNKELKKTGACDLNCRANANTVENGGDSL